MDLFRTDFFFSKPDKKIRKFGQIFISVIKQSIGFTARGRDSSVGIATGYRLDGPGIESRWGRDFPRPVQTCPGTNPASYTMGTGSFPGIKRPGRGVDHPPPCSAEVEGRVGLYICSPSGPSWPVIGWPLPLPLSRILRLRDNETIWRDGSIIFVISVNFLSHFFIFLSIYLFFFLSLFLLYLFVPSFFLRSFLFLWPLLFLLSFFFSISAFYLSFVFLCFSFDFSFSPFFLSSLSVSAFFLYFSVPFPSVFLFLHSSLPFFLTFLLLPFLSSPCK